MGVTENVGVTELAYTNVDKSLIEQTKPAASTRFIKRSPIQYILTSILISLGLSTLLSATVASNSLASNSLASSALPSVVTLGESTMTQAASPQVANLPLNSLLITSALKSPLAGTLPFTNLKPIPQVAHVWGYSGTESFVTAMVHDPVANTIYVGGQQEKREQAKSIGPKAGVGFVCLMDDLLGCLSAPDGGTTKAITDSHQTESMVDGLAIHSGTLYIAGKAKKSGEVDGCIGTSPGDRATDGWIQARSLTNLSRNATLACAQPQRTGNDEGLTVLHHNGHVYWGGTEWNHVTDSDQDGVVYKQADSLSGGILNTFSFTGAELTEVFDIELGDSSNVNSPTLIYVTGRAGSDFINEICLPQVLAPNIAGRTTSDVCSGAYGSDTTMFVAALTSDTLELVWLYMDSSNGGSSVGSALEYYNVGGEEGLIVAGLFYEGQDCNGWQGAYGTGPGYNKEYPNASITYLKLTNGMFFTDSPVHSIHSGKPCVGDSLADLSLHGNTIYAVGAVRGCRSHQDCVSEDAVIHRYTISNSVSISDAVTINRAAGVTMTTGTVQAANITTTAQLLFDDSWVYKGIALGPNIDSTDRFLAVHFDGAHVHVGGETRSDTFVRQSRTGLMDSVYLKFHAAQFIRSSFHPVGAASQSPHGTGTMGHPSTADEMSIQEYSSHLFLPFVSR